jgi:hypothetical protein
MVYGAIYGARGLYMGAIYGVRGLYMGLYMGLGGYIYLWGLPMGVVTPCEKPAQMAPAAKNLMKHGYD